MNHIADLDAALSRRGNDVTLRRMTDPVTDLTIRANVRPYTPDEIAGGVLAGDEKMVISPTGLDDDDWKAAFVQTGGLSLSSPFDVDSALPKKGDKVISGNRLMNIEAVMPVRIDGVVVRIEMQVRG